MNRDSFRRFRSSASCAKFIEQIGEFKARIQRLREFLDENKDPKLLQKKFPEVYPGELAIARTNDFRQIARMSFTGVINGGQVVAEQKINLPDGTKVRIEPLAPAGQPTHAEIFREFIGVFDDLPPDLAEHHDHYAHGKPVSA